MVKSSSSLDNVYRESVREDIRRSIERTNCRPILFLGSGFTQRYFGLPNWNGLLDILCKACPRIDHQLPYHLQKHGQDPLSVAEAFAEHYLEWGWTEGGKDFFPESCYGAHAKPQGFLKSYVATYLQSAMLPFLSQEKISPLSDELTALQRVRPYAVITTNYDSGVELVFPDYGVIKGEKVLHADTNNLGDILKIHGCISEPESIVLTKSDYEDYRKKRKYLSAKLLAYFAEHPLVFIGYSVSDPNVREILADIDEVLACSGDQVPNLYIVSHKESVSNTITDIPVNTSDHHFVRIKEICSKDFGWIYESLAYQGAVDLDVKTLRLLQSQMHKLVRADAPGGRILVNYQTLKGVLEKEEGLSNVLGICPINDPAHINVVYPFRLSEVAAELGYKNWNHAKKLIKQIKDYKGIDICDSDNKYHFAVPNGKTSIHKYSQETVALLLAVKDGLEYELEM